MSNPISSISRLVARVTAVFEADWFGMAGERWRQTVSKLANLNRKHLQLEDKAGQAPDLLWRAGVGFATEKHAKATADYEKAENDRIDAALKRRVLEDKARQERAMANKLEAEAVQARIQEIKARVALDRELEGLGVAIQLDSDGTIRAMRYSLRRSDAVAGGLLDMEEQEALQSALIDVVIPGMGDEIREGKLTRWIRKRGDHVERDEPILELATTLVDTEIPCPADGTMFEILVAEGERVEVSKTVVARIDPGSAGA
jgi:biotin carboxyl carrier protein